MTSLPRLMVVSTLFACTLLGASLGGCAAAPSDEGQEGSGSAIAAAAPAECARGNARLFEPGALSQWRGLRSDGGPANFETAKWMAWLSNATYDDDFGDLDDPGFVFRCGFHRMGFGHRRSGTFRVTAGERAVELPFADEGELWWKAGAALKQLAQSCNDEALAEGKTADCRMRDALEKDLFTQLPLSRSIGKLHGQTLKGMDRFKQGTTQAFFFHDEARRYAVVAFRGTQKVRESTWQISADALADLNILPMDLGDGVKVHSGFHHALHEPTDASRGKSAAELLLERLGELPGGTDLYLTGHSLGGALATMFAAEVLGRDHRRPYTLRGLYTFGAPAAGNAAFGERLNEGLRREQAWHGRFTYGNDPISGSTNLIYAHNTSLGPTDDARGINLHCNGSGYKLSESPAPRSCQRLLADHGSSRYFSALSTLVRHARSDDDLRIDGD